MAVVYFPEKPKHPVKAVKSQRQRSFPEALIFKVASERLRRDGWRVVSEVPLLNSYRFIDGGAYRDGVVLAIEAKVYVSASLISQISTAQLAADVALVVVQKVPNKNNRWLEVLKKNNIGIWQVKDGQVLEITPWGKNEHTSPTYREAFKKHCLEAVEGLPGGLPQLSGDGPAIACLKRVREYQLRHPSAKWKEIYANVLNHYSSYQSMRGALKKITLA